jgi:hypothetical protein
VKQTGRVLLFALAGRFRRRQCRARTSVVQLAHQGGVLTSCAG